MTVHRFFVDPAALSGDRFRLPASVTRQLRTVLRVRDGERIVLLTGDGSESLCRVEGEECVVEERRAALGEPAHRLTVVQALLKGDSLEEVVQHGTEIGVAAFQLVVTERCVARELSARKLDRLRSIARESAEQSERGLVPVVEPPVTLRNALVRGRVMLHERESDVQLRDLPPPSALIIGPEGGFSPGERDAAVAAGLDVCGLGPRILRAETVASATAAVVLSRTGDFA